MNEMANKVFPFSVQALLADLLQHEHNTLEVGTKRKIALLTNLSMKLSSTGVRCNQVLAYFMADTIMHPLKYQLGSHSRFREEQGHQAELAPHNHNKLIRVCTASVLHAGLW